MLLLDKSFLTLEASGVLKIKFSSFCSGCEGYAPNGELELSAGLVPPNKPPGAG